MQNPFEVLETKIDQILIKIESLEKQISSSDISSKNYHQKEYIHIDELCNIFGFPKRETIYAFNHRIKKELELIDKYLIKGAKGELYYPIEAIDVIRKIKRDA